MNPPQDVAIKALPEEERPREKLISQGPAALSDAELLAILLRTGYKGTPVLTLAAQLIHHFQSLERLLCATPSQLQALKGLGKAKATELGAILEMCQRVLSEKMSEQNIINSPDATRQYLQLHFRDCKREQFACLFLDTRHRVLALETLFQGTVDTTPVYPREIAKRALELNAAAVIATHNHPSGDPQPSQADITITKTLQKALALLDIRLLDHIIIGKGVTLSLAEQGLM